MLQKSFLQGVEFSNPDLQAFETFFFRFELWQETDSIVEPAGCQTYAAFEYSLRTDSDLGSDATPTLLAIYYFARSLEENMDSIGRGPGASK